MGSLNYLTGCLFEMNEKPTSFGIGIAGNKVKCYTFSDLVLGRPWELVAFC
jgi:hypothetical protein